MHLVLPQTFPSLNRSDCIITLPLLACSLQKNMLFRHQLSACICLDTNYTLFSFQQQKRYVNFVVICFRGLAFWGFFSFLLQFEESRSVNCMSFIWQIYLLVTLLHGNVFLFLRMQQKQLYIQRTSVCFYLSVLVSAKRTALSGGVFFY